MANAESLCLVTFRGSPVVLHRVTLPFGAVKRYPYS